MRALDSRGIYELGDFLIASNDLANWTMHDKNNLIATLFTNERSQRSDADFVLLEIY